MFLDLESPRDLAKLSDIEQFCELNDELSLKWRVSFVRSYLEQDIPQLGPTIPAEPLQRFWTMITHKQGQLFNATEFARGLDVASVSKGFYYACKDLKPTHQYIVHSVEDCFPIGPSWQAVSLKRMVELLEE